jgi:Zn-dependent M28 family amino/carboxypeptidase
MPKMKLRNLFSLCCLGLVAGDCLAQNQGRPSGGLDPKIQGVVAAVSRERLQASNLTLVKFGTRHTLGTSLPPGRKAGVVEARQWLTSQLQQLAAQCQGCLEVKSYAFTEGPAPRIPQPTELVDVYAVQKGSDPEAAKRIILIGAHYDTIAMARMNDAEAPAPGANDDGSGTSLVLEAARVLSQQKFPATIVYALFPGEEQGLFGSKGFAKMAKAEAWKLEAVLSNDIVGGDNTRNQQGLARIFSEGLPASSTEEQMRRLRLLGAESDSASRQLARYIASEVVPYLPAESVHPKLIFRQDRFLRGGDHTSFNEQGYPAVRITEFQENFDHQHQLPRMENGIEYGDLPKFVDYEYLAGVTRLNVASAALLASAPAPPDNVKLQTKELVNTSTLNWTGSREGSAAGYEVLYRDTTSPVWEHEIPAGADFQITVPYSKDNVVFAVRAYDAHGHRSLPVYPEPVR